ncbi:ABC transporter ATP-binding protein [Microbulbifer halophilus]|uniref:ABC transporter ATP-binding protein n=1 Tax=Microbulbifer halophilus TaxID=453963 RepID=A0ABW5E975_9GAMM|nr:ABC transporter ATP-binding protein [Microbulbifer halophilus]MCW8125437.1 ABC transporter ATP-binding protein [Microbulbifer halophilus]
MLQIRNLCKTYDNRVQALKNVNLDIPKGMFGLLGPNGAGKSSLMRTIATLQLADSGSITFDGIDVATQPEQIRASLGYLPQDFGVYPRISAEDMLEHMAVLKGISNKKQRRELVAELLAQTNLYKDRKNNLSGYSGGMRQRFGIAQALIGDPKLIIVDEPTAGLDPQERNRFHNLLSEIGENVVVILSTHIVEDVADLCPSMAILAGGQIVAGGRPEELVEKLRGRIWRKTVDKSELAQCRADFDVISTRLFAGKTLVHVLSDGQPHESFEPLRPDLEDVYFSTLFDLERSSLETAA